MADETPAPPPDTPVEQALTASPAAPADPAGGKNAPVQADADADADAAELAAKKTAAEKAAAAKKVAAEKKAAAAAKKAAAKKTATKKAAAKKAAATRAAKKAAAEKAAAEKATTPTSPPPSPGDTVSKSPSVHCYLVESLRGTVTVLRWVSGGKHLEATFEARVEDRAKAAQLPENVRPRKYIPEGVWLDAMKHPGIAHLCDGAHPSLRAIGPMPVPENRIDEVYLSVSQMVEARGDVGYRAQAVA